jgi:adenylate cyclase
VGTWVCASCGGENPAGTAFCGHCGARAPAAAGTASPAATTATTGPATATPVRVPAVPDAVDTLRSFVAQPVADRLIESGGHIAEERRLITALFADISGFTSLSERVDAEGLLDIIDPIVTRLSAIVGRYGGYVEKYAGDALLALFGAPIAHDDDAERALLVALEMHDEIARIRDELPSDAAGLTLHIGVNTGHGIARVMGSAGRLDYAVLGDSVILAQRLESAAGASETYVGDVTRALTRGRFAFESVGQLTLKGKEQTVAAWRLVGALVGTEPGLAGATRVPLGRERELAVLAARLDALAARTGGVVSIVGEPGVGKSLLASVARDVARARNIRWLETRCLSYGSALAYRPIAELIRAFAGIRFDALPDAAGPALRAALDEAGVAGALPFFARLIGVPASGADETEIDAAALSPEAFQRELHAAVHGWLATVARDRPLVVFVEDGHWIDSSSLALLTELATTAPTDNLLLVVTSQIDGRRGADAIREAAPEPDRAAIEVAPLDRPALESLAIARLDGGRVSPETIDVLMERTAGNPFFAEELLEEMRESGALESHDGRWSLTPGWDRTAVPASVEGVLAARLDRLPRHAAAVLQTAAVVGRRIRQALLRGVLVDDARLDVALDELVAIGFLDRNRDGTDELAFHHALVQDVAYGRLLRRQRRDLHRRVAAVAAALYGTGDDYIDLLARHLYLGDAGRPAVDALIRSSRRARGLFANAEAILDLQRALEVATPLALEDDSIAARLPEIRLELGDLYDLTGDYQAAHDVFRSVADLTGDVRAWQGLASVLRKRGSYAEALGVIDVALAAVGNQRVETRGLILERAWTLIVAGRPGEAIEAVATVVDPGAPPDLPTARLLLQEARARTVLEDRERALEAGEQAEALLRSLGDQRWLATAVRIVGEALANRGRLDEAADRLREGVELSERIGTVEELGGALVNLGLVELARGEVAAGIECDRRAVELFERVGHASGRAIAYGNLAEKLLAADELEEALAAADQALQFAAAIGHEGTIADAGRTRALVLERLGRHFEAAQAADAAAEAFGRIGAADAAAETRDLAASARAKANNTKAELARS